MRSSGLAVVLAVVAVTLAACSGGSDGGDSVDDSEAQAPAAASVAEASEPVAPAASPPPGDAGGESSIGLARLGFAPPSVDVEVASVPLDEVVFDTFDGSFVPLSTASAGLIEQLRDAIPPVYEPRYGSAAELPWLEPEDLVLGYESDGRTYAYPLQVLNLRELVNDTIDGVPLLISYCPLCGSAVVFDRCFEGRTLLFGNTSALYESDLVMYDYETGSYWFQVAGRAIVGELTGSALDVVPSFVAAWAEWEALHPDTLVLVGDGDESFGSDRYARDPFEGYERIVDSGRFAFPVSEAVEDDRLQAAEVVVVVGAGGVEKAFPSSLLESGVNAEVGGVPVLVAPTSGGTLAAAYDRRLGEQVLSFEAAGSELVDLETGRPGTGPAAPSTARSPASGWTRCRCGAPSGSRS